MNRLLNRTQWEESNDPTPVRIELVLVKMLMVEVYSLIQMQSKYSESIYKIPQYLNQYSIFLIADWTIEFASLRASKWPVHQ